MSLRHAGTRVLDLACGKGELLCRWADWFGSGGVGVREMVLADQGSWDRYEAAHWATIADWLDANPDDPDHATMRGILDRDRDTYLRWGRLHLGWGVFVTRPR